MEKFFSISIEDTAAVHVYYFLLFIIKKKVYINKLNKRPKI